MDMYERCVSASRILWRAPYSKSNRFFDREQIVRLFEEADNGRGVNIQSYIVQVFPKAGRSRNNKGIQKIWKNKIIQNKHIKPGSKENNRFRNGIGK